VRLEALRIRAGVVDFDHARADIDAYELRDIRREGARYLACLIDSAQVRKEKGEIYLPEPQA